MDKGKGKIAPDRTERLGTPVARERSSAPSPSPSFYRMDSPTPVASSSSNSVPGNTRAFGSGRDVRASTPLKRFPSTSFNEPSTPTVTSSRAASPSISHAGDLHAPSISGAIASANGQGATRVLIRSDPSITSAFKMEEDRELWELFLR